MITIKHYNDGKEKAQSYECSVSFPVTEEKDEYLHFCGYGETEEEAFNDMKEIYSQAAETVYRIGKLIDNYSFSDIKNENAQGIEYVKVNWLGDKIE